MLKLTIRMREFRGKIKMVDTHARVASLLTRRISWRHDVRLPH